MACKASKKIENCRQPSSDYKLLKVLLIKLFEETLQAEFILGAKS